MRTISLAYSRITFADIATKLLLDSSEDAEHIVAKVDQDLRKKKKYFFFQAIRDGVIEAVLDHESGTMQSKDTSDVYSTRQAKITLQDKNKKKII